MLMVMHCSNTKAVYFTAHLGLSLGPLKVAEHIFSGVKNRWIVFYIITNPDSAVLGEGNWEAI